MSEQGQRAIRANDPGVIIAGIRQFGLAADGSDLRDLESSLTASLSREAALVEALEKLLNAADDLADEANMTMADDTIAAARIILAQSQERTSEGAK